MKTRVMFLFVMVALWCTPSKAVDKKFKFAERGGFASEQVTVPYTKFVRQGFGLLMWESNEMTLGREAVDGTNIPLEASCGVGVGAEYPPNSCQEHLYGAGPWFAAIIEDTLHGTFTRAVKEGYDGDAGDSQILPNIQDTARDRIWTTSVEDTAYDSSAFGYYKRPMNHKGYDDDHDGKIDEDELDGLDNDHDWIRATDDIGADGVPDSLEVGCKGVYDPIRNPDPAYDDYNPSAYDSCHPNSDGSFPRMNDKNKYTENNGIPDHGEPHVDEDYGAVSDNDLYFSATDTFKTPIFAKPTMGLKVFCKSYAYSTASNYKNALLPFDYYFFNIGHNKLDSVYVGVFADMDVGPVKVNQYYLHNYAAYNDSVKMAYIQNPIDSGSTPLGVTLIAAPKPIAQVEKYIFQWWNLGGGPGPEDSVEYAWMSGEAYPASLIDANQPVSALSDTRFLLSFGPFGPLSPGDTLHITLAFVVGNCVEGCPGSLIDNARTVARMFGGSVIASVPTASARMPRSYVLHQSYPNPFNPSTQITYDLPTASRVTLTVYNVLGQTVRTLIDGEQEAGHKSIQFNAGGLASGVYFYRLQAESFSEIKKMELIK